jgi:hypothetical protein
MAHNGEDSCIQEMGDARTAVSIAGSVYVSIGMYMCR